jgi:hypothetical protein
VGSVLLCIMLYRAFYNMVALGPLVPALNIIFAVGVLVLAFRTLKD